MALYKWDKESKTWVKFSDRSYTKGTGSAMRPLEQQVMEGYRKCASRGDSIYGSPAGIKKIWGNN